ncbi:hypothetical protein [uncultured Duncaniella sp.]|uniref:hypothetical protein n=1 Tax=uncultured Duncaniella sp. TaxID=2768039 RepID=UPI002625E9BB|nr:hypothetical protein [uncultured Duncaniella sp.]
MADMSRMPEGFWNNFCGSIIDQCFQDQEQYNDDDDDEAIYASEYAAFDALYNGPIADCCDDFIALAIIGRNEGDDSCQILPSVAWWFLTHTDIVFYIKERTEDNLTDAVIGVDLGNLDADEVDSIMMEFLMDFNSFAPKQNPVEVYISEDMAIKLKFDVLKFFTDDEYAEKQINRLASVCPAASEILRLEHQYNFCDHWLKRHTDEYYDEDEDPDEPYKQVRIAPTPQQVEAAKRCCRRYQ